MERSYYYITIPTNTLVLLIKAIKNWQQLLIRLKSNEFPRYLVNKYFQMKTMEYFYNPENFVWIFFRRFQMYFFAGHPLDTVSVLPVKAHKFYKS